MDFSIFQVDWLKISSHAVHMLIAYGLALPLGLDRQLSDKAFGLRTFPLVAVVSCGYMLVGMSVIDSTDGEARVIQGIITGIGFIGGGAILKNENSITGTASAASIWNTGAIGLAVAYRRYEIAIVLSLINVVTLRIVKILQSKVEDTIEEFENDSED